MSRIQVAGLQLDIAWEDPDENFRRATQLAERAAAAGSQLLVLPEMFNTGFSMDAQRVAPHAEATRDFLGALSQRLGVWLMAGYADTPAPGSERPRNACSFYAPDGTEATRYHKIHPFSLAGEHEHYAGGTTLPSCDIDGVRVIALVCYDLRFPEPFRAAAERTDLFVVVANWPDARVGAWSSLLVARAIENQAFVLGVNRYGEDPNGNSYRGCSALLDPLGEQLAGVAGQEGMLSGIVDAGRVADVRGRLGFLKDRRPAVYAGL